MPRAMNVLLSSAISHKLTRICTQLNNLSVIYKLMFIVFGLFISFNVCELFFLQTNGFLF